MFHHDYWFWEMTVKDNGTHLRLMCSTQAFGQVKAAKMNVLQRYQPKAYVQQAGKRIVRKSMVWVMVIC